MNFAHPWWLLAGVIACGAMWWVWRRYDARQRAALDRFIAPELRTQLTQSVSRTRILARRVLFAASVTLLFAALAEPQAGFRWEQAKRRGNEIIFAVDTSRSMTTPDVKPNRLTRAKMAIDDFVNRLDGDAVGLIAFSGTAFLQTPITLDYGAFHESLSALDTHIIPRGGTRITSAITEARAAFRQRPGSDKILILVTDGEDLEGDSLAAAKAAATQDGLKIFTVGVGSANGDLIPLPTDQGGGFMRDRDGHLVKSRLDESALKALAAATGGSYAPLGAENQGLDTIYQEALAPLGKHVLESRAQKVYTQRFQWPLGAALLLLAGSLMVGTRRRVTALRTTPVVQPLSRFALHTVPALFGVCWLLPMHSAHGSPSSAAVAYQHGDFTAAERDYTAAAASNPKQPTLQFNAGAAAYKAGEYPQAAQAFQASVNATTSGDAHRLAEQEDAYYNLGNTQYREGQKTEKDDPEATIKAWTQAVKTYDAALQLRADDADSKFNRDLVSRKLEALRKTQAAQKQSPQQPPQPHQSQAQSKDQPNASKPPQQAGQSKQQPGGQAQAGKGQSDHPLQAEQNPSATPPGKDQKNLDQAPRSGQPNESPPAGNGAAPRGDRGELAQAADEQRAAGDMSRQEARELLDSVKGEVRRAPGAPVARNGAGETSSDDPLKDW